MARRLILMAAVAVHLYLGHGGWVQSTHAADPTAITTPPAIPGNVAWWVADDKKSVMTIVDVVVPADLTTWKDPTKGFTVTGGQPDPLGGKSAFRVMENSGAGERWLVCEPAGYVQGPCKLAFQYKPINGASVWTADGTTFYSEFEFRPDGDSHIGNHPYALGDNTWSSVKPSTGGFYSVDVWWQGATHIRKSVAISTVSNGTKPPMSDGTKGFDLCGLTFSQHYVTKLKDQSTGGADLTAPPADAPFVQRSSEPAGLLTGGSCVWQPDEECKFLSSSNGPLCAVLGGNSPHTVIVLVRRQWCRGESQAAALFLKGVASSGSDYCMGFTPSGGNGRGNQLFAGVAGSTGPVGREPVDTEWNAVAVICAGPTASIYLLDGPEPKLVAGPTAVSRGVISSVRLCTQRSGVREAAVWNQALDLKTAHAQAQGMIARAGGPLALNTFKTFDGLTIETRTKAAPYHWRDDAGTAFFKDACWIVAGAVETVTNSNDVWKSTDYGATWTEVEQKTPFAPSQGAAAFTLTLGGMSYLYYVACYETNGGVQSIYRSVDGSTWVRMCEAPPWKNHFGLGVGVLGTDIFVMGGQFRGRDPESAVNQVFKSSDGGATWARLPDAPWKPRMAFGPILPFWKGKLWVVHGGTYGGFSGKPSEKFDDVWSFDGSTWERVSEHTPWAGTLWGTTFAMDDELFVMAGWAKDGDHRMMWRTADGVRWQSCFPLPWGLAHESCTTQTDRGVLLAPTDWNQTTRLLKGRAAEPKKP